MDLEEERLCEMALGHVRARRSILRSQMEQVRCWLADLAEEEASLSAWEAELQNELMTTQESPRLWLRWFWQ